MTHYIYKGEEIPHISFISLCQRNGICGGRNASHYEKLVEMAEKGNERAIAIMNDLEIRKTPNDNMKNITPHSPKNRYYVEVYFPKPLKNLGSVVSFGTMTLDNVEDTVRKYYMYNQPVVRVAILENLKTYPEFEWKKVSMFDVTPA